MGKNYDKPQRIGSVRSGSGETPIFKVRGKIPIAGTVDPKSLQQATPDEIFQAKEDQECPRCESKLCAGIDGALCDECGFSY